MTAIARAAAATAAVLAPEGIDYAQSKAVFKAARARAGLHAAPERRSGVDRLTVEEELRFLDQAYAQGVLRAAAILRRTDAVTGNAARGGLARLRIQPALLDPGLVPPWDVQVVLVRKPGAPAQLQRRQGYIGRGADTSHDP